MILPKLYARSSKGAILEWSIEVADSFQCYRTVHGQVNGKLQISKWFTVKAMNVGRANERSVMEQVIAEATSKWNKKKATGYYESMGDIDTLSYIEPMLADDWKARQDKITFPVYCQPKLDGMRAIITREGAKSRNGKPWNTIPHILKSLEPVFDKYPDLVLDGELYNHEYKDDFNAISSLVKKTKPTEEDLIESAGKVEFWWYDIADAASDFENRYERLTEITYEFQLAHKKILKVDTIFATSKEKLDAAYENWLNEGYEGQMVRVNASYAFKRSSNLLKRKEFITKEYKIIHIGEGNGNKSGMAGYMILEREDGVQFNSNIKGNRAFLTELLKTANQYIGKYAICKFFNLTPDGIPRFPYVIGFRDGIGID